MVLGTGLVFRRRKVRRPRGRTKCGYCWPVTRPSNDMSRSSAKRTLTTPPLKPTLKNERDFTCGKHFGALAHFAISGTSKLLITRTTGWRLHHRVPLVRGGSKSAENRVLLHPECHDKVHLQNLSVSKPRLPQRGVRTACRMSTKVSRPVLRGPSLSKGAWLLGSNRSRHFSGTG